MIVLGFTMVSFIHVVCKTIFSLRENKFVDLI